MFSLNVNIFARTYIASDGKWPGTSPPPQNQCVYSEQPWDRRGTLEGPRDLPFTLYLIISPSCPQPGPLLPRLLTEFLA